MPARKKPDGPEPLVLHIGDESFAFTSIEEVGDGDGGQVKVPVPSLDWLEQLSFKEQLEVRKIARDLSGNPSGEPTDFAFMDLAPALLTVVNKRTDQNYTLDDALALDWKTVQARPTKPSS